MEKDVQRNSPCECRDSVAACRRNRGVPWNTAGLSNSLRSQEEEEEEEEEEEVERWTIRRFSRLLAVSQGIHFSCFGKPMHLAIK